MIMLLIGLAAFAEEQQKPVQDLNLLVGKKVLVQRSPLCQPGTYTAVLSYSGKQARVVSMKPSSVAPLSQRVMDRLTPQARALMEDAQKAATILIQFEDGTQLDTCAPIGPTRLSMYFELAPGETLQSVAPAAPKPPTSVTDVLSDDEVKLAVSGKGKDHWVL